MRLISKTLILLVLAICSGMGSSVGLAQEGCQSRACDIGSESQGCGPRQFCDMVRNACVPKCEAGDCCGNVDCPEGTACVPWRGQCGLLAGPDCFDLGSSWSTLDLGEGATASTVAGERVDFVILNRTGKTLYFPASTARPRVRFDIYTWICGTKRQLELPENQFCPNWCPAAGPIRELDCRRPDPVVLRLNAADAVRITWSGNEATTHYRSCASSNFQSCLRKTQTRVGSYAVEICAYSRISSDSEQGDTENMIEGAHVAGPAWCLREDFKYPGQSEIVLTFVE